MGNLFTCSDETEGEECSICLATTERKKTLRCGHSFCHECISLWKEKSKECPMCRGVEN